MSKVLELVMISILLVSAFFFGVGYSDPVKENLSWLFEVKEQEVAIPEIGEQNIAKPERIQDNTAIDNAQEIDTSTTESFDKIDQEIN